MQDIDPDHIEAMGGFGSPELVEILEDFLNGLDKQCEELARASKDDNRESFRELAHRLKGSAQMSGFPRLGSLAARWETVSREESLALPEASALQLELTDAIQSARSGFRQEVSKS